MRRIMISCKPHSLRKREMWNALYVMAAVMPWWEALSWVAAHISLCTLCWGNVPCTGGELRGEPDDLAMCGWPILRA